jgi:hypothetical protein
MYIQLQPWASAGHWDFAVEDFRKARDLCHSNGGCVALLIEATARDC